VKLATVRFGGGHRAVRIEEGDSIATLLPEADVAEVFHDPSWRFHALEPGPPVPTFALDFAPLIPRPDKIICVGLNYRSHIAEMGREQPQFPTVFAKYRSSLIGDGDDIVLPAASEMVDWEAELAIVIGAPIRHGDRAEAELAIAGYTVLNDVTARDWQSRTTQFLQGKTFESTTPVGPWMVTPDEPGAAPGPGQRIACSVNGEVMQDATTADLLFDPFDLVAYLSTIVTLLPGDIIATGTPAGVGAGRTPPRFLADGDEVVTSISGVGELRNRCRREGMA
jgi:acylpyruvate hydrolase